MLMETETPLGLEIGLRGFGLNDQLDLSGGAFRKH